ncbi:MAG: hypothetical protein IPN19_15340 [Elusimicrobia bacterium]|nr:hypothetical protein [Elusimicrobiota bacterium]
MSAFPTLSHDVSSTREPNDGAQVDYGDDGTARVRVMFAATQWAFTLNLNQLTTTELATLMAHYAAHKSLSFSYTWPEDNTTYTCIYVGYPAPKVSAAYARRDVTIKLAGMAA